MQMLSRLAFIGFCLAFTLTTVSAQGADQQPTPQPPPPKAAPPPPSSPPQVLLPRAPRGQDVNVQIEITINDQTGTAAPEKKTVSLLVADRSMGRVRANAETSKPSLGRVGTNLNVDARPTLLDSGRILLELTLEYTPLRDSDVVRPTNLNESLTVILVNGKPLTISQAADPISDRRMTVEVKATILK